MAQGLADNILWYVKIYGVVSPAVARIIPRKTFFYFAERFVTAAAEPAAKLFAEAKQMIFAWLLIYYRLGFRLDLYTIVFTSLRAPVLQTAVNYAVFRKRQHIG